MVDLFAHLGDGIVVLLAQVGKDGFVLNVGLLQIAAEFAQFSFAFLVELDLSGGGATSLLQTLTEFLEFTSQIGALLLGLVFFPHTFKYRFTACRRRRWSYLGASLALGFDLFFELFDAGLELLDLFLELGNQRLLIFELGVQRGDLLVFALDRLFQFLLVALQIGNSLLGQFQVTFSLALVLLNVGAVIEMTV